MKKQKWSEKTLFEKADEFFQSLGLRPMTREFWRNSVFKRPRRARNFNCRNDGFIGRACLDLI